jgi:hypothetical protein
MNEIDGQVQCIKFVCYERLDVTGRWKIFQAQVIQWTI